MARKLIVEVILDAQQFLTGLKRSSRAAGDFERNLTGIQRTTDLGSSAFRGLGKSLAFVTGGYVALDSASKFLGDSIQAARDAESANRSLAAQMKAAGESFAANRGRVAATARSYARFGFSSDEVTKSLAILERGSGNIDKALKAQMLTADLARAKDIDLASAASIVAKALGGQETGLRRNIPALSKNLHGTDLLAQASRRLHGQAAANTDQAQEFAAALRNTEEIIGAALLPTINKYLGRLSKWLENSRNQKTLQKDINDLVTAASSGFNTLADAIKKANAALDGYNKQIGRLPGGKKGFLQTLLGAGIHAIPNQARAALKSAQDVIALFTGGPKVAPPLSGLFGPDQLKAFLQSVKPPAGAGGAAAAGARPLSLQGRFNLAELRLAQAQLTKTLADDRRILVVERGITEQQIDQAKSLKDKTKFTQQLVDINQRILSIDQQRTDALKQQADLLKQQADAIKSALIDQLQAKQARTEDTRALRDALDQQRIAKLGGGPVGIRLAGEAVHDARFKLFMDKLEQAPATLTKAGQFTLGNVITVNVHGVTDPDKVAKAVVAAIRRGERHGSPQSRGASTGAGAPR